MHHLKKNCSWSCLEDDEWFWSCSNCLIKVTCILSTYFNSKASQFESMNCFVWNEDVVYQAALFLFKNGEVLFWGDVNDKDCLGEKKTIVSWITIMNQTWIYTILFLHQSQVFDNVINNRHGLGIFYILKSCGWMILTGCYHIQLVSGKVCLFEDKINLYMAIAMKQGLLKHKFVSKFSFYKLKVF